MSATLVYEMSPAIISPLSTAQRIAVPRAAGPSADVTTSEYGEFAHHFSKLRKLAFDRSLAPEGADMPSEGALAAAYVVLQSFQTKNILPSKVVASAEGGVAICFIAGKRYADIESLNSGAILGVLSDKRNPPIVWEVEQSPSGISCTASRIREFFKSPET